MAAHRTRKTGSDARSATIANRQARAVKRGQANINRAGHVRRTR